MYFIASSFGTPITRKASTTGVNSRKGDRHSHELGPLPWKERLWGQVSAVSAGRRGSLWASLAPTGWMQSWSLHSNVWIESKRQWHKLKHKRLNLEIRRNLFPKRMVQHWGWGSGTSGCPQPGRFEAQTGWNLEQAGLAQYLNTLWVGGQQFLADWFILCVGFVLTWCFTFYGMFHFFFILGGDSIWLELYSSWIVTVSHCGQLLFL